MTIPFRGGWGEVNFCIKDSLVDYSCFTKSTLHRVDMRISLRSEINTNGNHTNGQDSLWTLSHRYRPVVREIPLAEPARGNPPLAKILEKTLGPKIGSGI